MEDDLRLIAMEMAVRIAEANDPTRNLTTTASVLSDADKIYKWLNEDSSLRSVPISGSSKPIVN